METMEIFTGIITLIMCIFSGQIGMFILDNEEGGFDCWAVGCGIGLVLFFIAFFILYKIAKRKTSAVNEKMYKIFAIIVIVAAVVFCVAVITNIITSTSSGHLERWPWGKHEWVAVTDSVYYHHLAFAGIPGLIVWLLLGCCWGIFIEEERG